MFCENHANQWAFDHRFRPSRLQKSWLMHLCLELVYFFLFFSKVDPENLIRAIQSLNSCKFSKSNSSGTNSCWYELTWLLNRTGVGCGEKFCLQGQATMENDRQCDTSLRGQAIVKNFASLHRQAITEIFFSTSSSNNVQLPHQFG